ncbi:MAG: FAD binding domain-containing protein [Planctomycetota bacterium]
MLRMQGFDLATPTSVEEAVALLAEEGAHAMAGGTDLLPNVKHELVEPRRVVALAGIAELRGVERAADGGLSIGAMTTLDALAKHGDVLANAPALAQAASLVAGPQLRRMGTLGGNVLLDTRCQWYNQTYFWREALGFCLKKDGTACHVVESGSKCVAAASNDTAPALITLDAELEFANADGRRRVAIKDLYKSDGAANLTIEKRDLLVRVHVPATPAGHRGAYGKLRERNSIDFPLLGIAARLDVGDDGAIARADLAAVALPARPLALTKAASALVGARPDDASFDEAVANAVEFAHKQLHPVENVPGDAAWRRAMARVYVRETLRAAATGSGPVHGR